MSGKQEPDLHTSLQSCYHCGEDCKEAEIIHYDEKDFCCEGCKIVYDILSENNLCTYYELENSPGISRKISVRKDKFAFLDNPDSAQKLIRYSDENLVHVNFYIPRMHCSSCIWLLEYLHKLDEGVQESRVDFTAKECRIIFDKNKTSLRKVAELLTSIGYEPHISFNELQEKKAAFVDRKLTYRLGVAGFCFGNIMLMSFPEYFSVAGDHSMFRIFSYLNLALGTLVFAYPANLFFESAYKGLRQKFLNIDVPVALAIIITYLRSVVDIVTNTGPGFMDSMAAIVFFMLVGRFYQDYSQRKLSFDRDYKSFFPASVNRLVDGEEEAATLDKLAEGDIIKIHHRELIPADGFLIKGVGSIDYSFVTGESNPQSRSMGELLYAGGRQMGQSIEIKLNRPVSQSYLTSLWEQNRGNFENKKVSFVHKLARNFTILLLVIVSLTAIFWGIYDPSKIFNTVTAMLIIACPCALLLAVTFTNGTMLNILSKNGLFLRNPTVLESIAEADIILFDKTGTITRSGDSEVRFEGNLVNQEFLLALNALSMQSAHPLSKGMAVFLNHELEKRGLKDHLKQFKVSHFEEFLGKGVQGRVNAMDIQYGSANFLQLIADSSINTRVHVNIEGEYLGSFVFANKYREGLSEMLRTLGENYQLGILSGDKPFEKENLSKIFPNRSLIAFEQLPEDKKNHIAKLQAKGHKTIMLGDGLNDAVALAQSNAGIAVTDDTNLFSPACDGILVGEKVTILPKLISIAKANQSIIYITFAVSILYNLVGLFFAVQGLLSPLIAAIIMPTMTTTIVLLTTFGGRFFAHKKGLKF